MIDQQETSGNDVSVHETQTDLKKGRADKKASNKRGKATTATATGRERRVRSKERRTESPQVLITSHMTDEHEQDMQRKEKQSAVAFLEEKGVDTDGLDENVNLLPKDPGQEGVEQRVSFIVRLTVDQRGEPRRLEIENTKTHKKESFSSLDGNQLTGFIRSSIHTAGSGEMKVSKVSQPKQPTPVDSEASTHKQTPSLRISNVQIYRSGDIGTISLGSLEDFNVQVTFHVQTQEVVPDDHHGIAYEITVYANGVGNSQSKLLANHSGNLNLDYKLQEYQAQVKVSGLSSGIYRLFSIVTLHTPSQIVGYFEGPIFQVL